MKKTEGVLDLSDPVRREKLRKQHSVTGCITVFIRTNPFNPQEPQYQPSASVKLDAATQDSRAITATANRLLKEIFKAGYGYHKCGVQLSHIQPEASPGQLELFDFADTGLPTENRQLMKAIDPINRRFPKAISVAAPVLIRLGSRERNGCRRAIRQVGMSWCGLNKCGRKLLLSGNETQLPTYTADPIHNVLTNDGIGDHAGTTPHVL